MMVAALLLAMACLQGTARAETGEGEGDLHLIVNRASDAIAIYAALPADLLQARFDGLPGRLQAGPEGIDIDSLSTGTVDIADWLIARSDARLGGAPAVLEPLSVMVHPTELGLPFETPRDGAIATSVCTAPPMGPLPLDALTLFAGFFLSPVDGAAPLMLRLGEAGPAGPITGQITVATFWDWLPMKETTATATADGWIDLGEGPRFPALVGASQALLVAGLATIAILGTVRIIVAQRQRPEPRNNEGAPPEPGAPAARRAHS